MGDHATGDTYDEQRHQGFLRALLDDVKALEKPVEGDLIEMAAQFFEEHLANLGDA